MNYSAHLARKSCALIGLLLGLVLHGPLAHAVTPPDADTVTIEKNIAAIVGGTNALTNTYSWMSALISKTTNTTSANSQRQFCGGSLIAPEWVLTAAHCVIGRQPSTFQVLVGRDNLDGSGGQLLDVSEIIINPRYKNLRNDVALIRLATPASATPVSLPSGGTGNTSTLANALGWGSNTGLKYPDCTVSFPQVTPSNSSDYSCGTVAGSKQGVVMQLQTAQLSVLTKEACYSHLTGYLQQNNYPLPAGGAAEAVPAGNLCVMDLVNKSTVCYGDSGGPLVVDIAGKAVVIGVSSFLIEKKCQGTYSLQFFTDVAYYLDFINQAMLSNKALNFSQLCPLPVVPTVSFDTPAGGTSRVVLVWNAADLAAGYTLLYVPLPRQGTAVGRLPLAAGTTEFSIRLPSGGHYMVAVQARGAQCDSSVSAAVEVSVP